MGVDISEPLRALLEAKGLTQEHLGDLAGIKRTDINLIANGRPVGKVRLRRIAEALDVEPADLAGPTQPGAPKNPLLAAIAEIKATLEAMSRREDDTEKRIAGQLKAQADLLATLTAVAAEIARGVDPPGETEAPPRPSRKRRPA